MQVLDPPLPDPDGETESSIRPHIIRGYAWMMAMRWGMRGLGLISTIILARLLTPTDFGLVAAVMLFIGLIEVFSETGQRLALVRLTTATREHFDTVWTISMLISLALFSAIELLSPLLPLFISDPRVEIISKLLGFRILLQGCENVGIVNFSRNLEYNKEFYYGMTKKIASFTTGLALAFLLRDYRALVLGIIVGQLIAIPASFIMSSFRPRISLAKVHEIWSYSLWVLATHLGAFLQSRIDQLVVSAAVPPSTMGQYSIAQEFASLPSTELVAPLGRSLFPAFSKLGNNPRELAKSYLNVLSVVAIICSSTSIGMAAVAHDFTIVILGTQWLEAAPLIPCLAIAAGLAACAQTVYGPLLAAGRARRTAAQSWLRALLELPLLLAGVHISGVLGVAVAKLLAIIVLFPFFFVQLAKVIPLGIRDLVAAFWRPLLSSATMAGAILLLPLPQLGDLPLLRLALHIVLGASVFVVALYGLWLLAGRPGGPERALLSAVTRFVTRK